MYCNSEYSPGLARRTARQIEKASLLHGGQLRPHEGEVWQQQQSASGGSVATDRCYGRPWLRTANAGPGVPPSVDHGAKRASILLPRTASDDVVFALEPESSADGVACERVDHAVVQMRVFLRPALRRHGRGRGAGLLGLRRRPCLNCDTVRSDQPSQYPNTSEKRGRGVHLACRPSWPR